MENALYIESICPRNHAENKSQYQLIEDNVMPNVDIAIACIQEALPENDDSFLDAKTFQALKHLVTHYGTYEYEFNLSMEHFVKRSIDSAQTNLASSIETPLLRLLNKNLSNIALDIADVDNQTLFAAYYCLSLIYKKTNNFDQLEYLASNRLYQNSFFRFPLFYEVQSRYLKRKGRLSEALIHDSRAIQFLTTLTCSPNHGLCISYASTVCTMLERREQIRPDEITIANAYVDAAIEYNPRYAKYYFIKAKLLYYSNFHAPYEVFHKICKTARALTRQAISLVMIGTGTYLEQQQEMNNYEHFDAQIQEELQERERRICTSKFVEFSAEEIASQKKQILESKKFNDQLRPCKPNLSDDDKYFFVCYTTRDYKSVYCDLIELYSQKIPFVYDERLHAGLTWDEQVEMYIKNNNCVGVVFYISKNTLISTAICEEIKKVCHELKKTYFAVNLEGTLLPSAIMMHTFLNVCNKDMLASPILAENIINFLTAFKDNGLFIPKFPVEGEAGTGHIESFKHQLRITFNLDL